MVNKSFINTLPFSQEREISTLVENKRSYAVDEMELHIFETYESSALVPLQFGDMVMINMLEGKKIMHVGQLEAFDYLPGQMLLLPAYTKMLIDFPDASLHKPTQCTALVVSKEKIDSILNYLNEFSPKHQLIGEWGFDPKLFHLYNTPELTELMNKFFKIMMENNPLKNVYADLTFKELLIRLLQTQSLLALEINQTTNSLFLNLKDFVRKHITEKISLESLQKVANMSKSSLIRMFKKELGISPMEYVINQRLQHAKELLRMTKSVKESCFGSGFTDVNYFVRLFKSREGVTPGGYLLSL
ncbi:AraC family transcriptional regulator [Sphingobacterium bovistauri]|uniref:AraC family transcriptional regulator N-terminal domain-containing protein n=1 Tax=Sphingobacterium bovistauri TaxID=2781959 RepID=A0ABS7ZCU2_9SPHI|nr:helix-turn-helix domain-containing protein [Sphingobacterium bovistauri]MCA5006700.1 AraC family transcriptional regulator N-terminal domain-containing protein [Sphingobacterium bovistauri]